jgi:hypothetical protein
MRESLLRSECEQLTMSDIMWDSVMEIVWRATKYLNQNSITSGIDSKSASSLYKKGKLPLYQYSICKFMLKHVEYNAC